MRRLIVVGIALLALPAIALAGATATDGNDTLKIKAKFDPAKASKRHGARRAMEADYAYHARTTDDSRLPDLRSVSVFLGGAVFGFDAFPKCEETKAVNDGADAACPDGSQVGKGTAVAELHDPNSPTSKADVKLDVTVFNAINQTDRDGSKLDTPKDGLIFYTQVGDTRIVLPFWSEDGAKRITFYNLENDENPPADNSTYAIKDAHLVFDRRSVRKNGHRVPFIGAPRKCKRSWKVTTTNDRYEGGKLTAKHKVKCRKA